VRPCPSHHSALAFLGLADLAARDPLPLSGAVLAVPLELFQPLACFGKVLGYGACLSAGTSHVLGDKSLQVDLPAARQYHLFASSKLAGTPMPTSVK
jgi:hypothetical protein